jgi:hypothetical protein
VVRAAAASALGRIGSRSSLPPLHGVAAHDRVPVVAREARAAIQDIEQQANSADADPDPSKKHGKPRYGLMLGEMRNQSGYPAPELASVLEHALERNLDVLPRAAVFSHTATSEAGAAQADGLIVFRLDANVTSLSAATVDDQVSVHCEVSLLIMDQPTGGLRTLLKGSARGVEVRVGARSVQELSIARRVVDAAVASALRNADAVIADAASEQQALPR